MFVGFQPGPAFSGHRVKVLILTYFPESGKYEEKSFFKQVLTPK
jgi:hypothetical protein